MVFQVKQDFDLREKFCLKFSTESAKTDQLFCAYRKFVYFIAFFIVIFFHFSLAQISLQQVVFILWSTDLDSFYYGNKMRKSLLKINKLVPTFCWKYGEYNFLLKIDNYVGSNLLKIKIASEKNKKFRCNFCSSQSKKLQNFSRYSGVNKSQISLKNLWFKLQKITKKNL